MNLLAAASSSQILTEIIELLSGSLISLGNAIGKGLSSMVQSLFLDTSADTTKLSTFGMVIMIFAGISLAIGMTKWVTNFVSSFGKSR